MSDCTQSEYPVNHAYAIRQLNVMADKNAHCARLVTGDHIAKYLNREENYRTVARMAQKYVVSERPMDQEIDLTDSHAIDEMIYAVIQATHNWAQKWERDPEVLAQIKAVEDHHEKMIAELREALSSSPSI